MRVLSASLIACALAACSGVQSPTPRGALPAGVTASIPMHRAPTLLAISPDGSRVFAASMGSLTIVDTSTNAVVATASSDPYVTGFTMTPDGTRILLTTASSSNLALLQATSGTAAGVISLPTNLYPGGYGRSAVSPDGRIAWVANEKQWLAIVDLAAAKARQRSLDLRPRDLAFSPDGRTVYVAGCKNYCTNGTLEVLDAASLDTQRTLTVGAAPFRVVVSPDGSHVYTTNGGNPSVSVVSLASGTLDANVPVGAEPTGLAVSPDGAHLYVASYAARTLTVVRTAKPAVVKTVPLEGQPRDVVVAPDGRRAYVSVTAPSAIVVLDAGQLAGP